MPQAGIFRPKNDRSHGYVVGASEEARICTECPLPAKKCRPLSCKRYKEEMQKIKSVKN